jgi:hypothetical protein
MSCLRLQDGYDFCLLLLLHLAILIWLSIKRTFFIAIRKSQQEIKKIVMIHRTGTAVMVLK